MQSVRIAKIDNLLVSNILFSVHLEITYPEISPAVRTDP